MSTASCASHARTARFAQVLTAMPLIMFCNSAMTIQQAIAETSEEMTLTEFAIISPVGRYGRTPFHLDPLQSAMVRRSFKQPKPGDSVLGYGGRAISWTRARAESDGWLVHSSLSGGYAYAEFDSATDRVMLLDASGHAMVYVNGVPRVGDPYLTGRTVLPVPLVEGKNRFLFHVAAGRLRAKLVEPPAEVFFDLRDNTLPTTVASTGVGWAGVLLVNCRDTPLPATQVSAKLNDGAPITSMTGSVPAHGICKLAIPFDGQALATDDEIDLLLQLELKDPVDNQVTAPLAGAEITLQRAAPGEPRVYTYESSLDGSVGTYALLPAQDAGVSREEEGEDALAPGILVSLHDARSTAVEHLEQYDAQTWTHILAPSGRRTEGCDWEDWHARDVLESLDHAQEHLVHDRQRVWLAGDGAGGHGVWRLATLAPDRWAAVAASNAWLNYPAAARRLPGDPDDTPVGSLLDRGPQALDLTPLLSNLRSAGVYLTYSEPVETDARKVLKSLASFHSDVVFRALATTNDQTHPWRTARSQVFSYLRKRAVAPSDQVTKVDFSTYDPALSSRAHWLTILRQSAQGELSRAVVTFDAVNERFDCELQNVHAFALDVRHLAPELTVEILINEESIGDVELSSAMDNQLRFLNSPIGWQMIPPMPASMKRPERNGGFRSAFENRAVLVYGTNGTEDENAWALAKARYDAETLLVRANGSHEVIADSEYRPDRYANRNVVLYGNADTNSAWPRLLSTSPVQVRKGEVRVDRRPETGDDLACLFAWPQQRYPEAVVGVVSGTGMAGFRATDRLPFFVNGTVFPDLLLLSSESLTQGIEEVRAAGYFGTAWTIEPGEILWRDTAL